MRINKCRVWVVENDDAQRKSIVNWLRLNGATTREFRTTNELQRALAQKDDRAISGSLQFDVIVLDLALGSQVDGYTVLDSLREELLRRVVVLSAWEGTEREGWKEKRIRYGHVPFLKKAANNVTEDLVALIERILRDHN